MSLYKEENLLISGGRSGGVCFWNENGNIVKKIQLFKTPISNLIVAQRPKELDYKKSIIHIKINLIFKPFKK